MTPTTSTTPDWTSLLASLAELPYGGEPVDQQAHALQCAHLARQAGADDELVAAAALHDIGRAPAVKAAHPSLPHEDAAERFCAEHLGPRVAYLVQQHVDAKRYLVTTDPTYHRTLTPVSQATLKAQGSEMTPEEVAAFEANPWHTDAVRLRRWDDQAKSPDAPTMPIPELVALLEGLAGRS